MKILKLPNHDHYSISGGMLCETYRGIKALVTYPIMKVPDIPDKESCTPEELEEIFSKYL